MSIHATLVRVGSQGKPKDEAKPVHKKGANCDFGRSDFGLCGGHPRVLEFRSEGQFASASSLRSELARPLFEADHVPGAHRKRTYRHASNIYRRCSWAQMQQEVRSLSHRCLRKRSNRSDEGGVSKFKMLGFPRFPPNIPTMKPIQRPPQRPKRSCRQLNSSSVSPTGRQKTTPLCKEEGSCRLS